MTPVLLPLPGNEEAAAALAVALQAERGAIEVRRFPDGDSYIRIDAAVAGRAVVLVCTLDRPDEKFIELWLTAATARDSGQRRSILYVLSALHAPGCAVSTR